MGKLTDIEVQFFCLFLKWEASRTEKIKGNGGTIFIICKLQLLVYVILEEKQNISVVEERNGSEAVFILSPSLQNLLHLMILVR